MPEDIRLKLNLFRTRKGEQPEAIPMYYVLGRKPAGGMVARVLVTEDLEVKAGDALVFDFTVDRLTVDRLTEDRLTEEQEEQQ